MTGTISRVALVTGSSSGIGAATARLLRTIIKNRGHFPHDDVAITLLWLAIGNIEDTRARARAKEKSFAANRRIAEGRLVEGATVNGWKAALGALALAYPDRLNPYLT